MNKELIELQRGCNATCVVIQNQHKKQLDLNISISSTCEESELLNIFKQKINEKFNYFVIKEIEKLEIEKQEKFYQIVKDREFSSYKLPKDVIIVLTVENEEGLKNIVQELYHLCVVAF